VLTTAPGYPIPERGATFAGASVLPLPLTEAKGFLPDLDAISDATWERAALLWINYPNNPTGATAPASFFAEAAERCRAHGVLLASDEAYTELWFEDGPPPSALQVGDLANVLVLHTLSKRSSMTGYRSGFAAGDSQLIAALRRLRPSVGVTPQEFVQRASVAAWNDEAHVEDTRARYDEKLALAIDHHQATDVALPHQLGGSFQGVIGGTGADRARHQLSDLHLPCLQSLSFTSGCRGPRDFPESSFRWTRLRTQRCKAQCQLGDDTGCSVQAVALGKGAALLSSGGVSTKAGVPMPPSRSCSTRAAPSPPWGVVLVRRPANSRK
jgi:hypothetical protein